MMIKGKNSFVGGALAITVAGFLTSLLGALLRPAMVRLFAPHDGLDGAFGGGLFQIPLAYYNLALSFTAFGLNTAVSRMVAAREAEGDFAAVKMLLRLSVYVTAVIGLIMAIAMFLGGSLLADVSANPMAALGFRLTAPAVLVVTISAAYRGFFQGLQRMAPVALSQVLEVFVRVGVGLAAVALIAGQNVVLAAALANGAAVVGAIIALLYLATLSRGVLSVADSTPARDSKWLPIVRTLVLTAIPVTLIGALQPVFYLSDTALAIRALQQSGLTSTVATALYGQLFQAYSIINLPPVVGQALYMSLVPSIARSIVSGDLGTARKQLTASLSYTLLFGVPASLGIWALARPVYRLMFGSYQGSELLAILSVCVLFLMINSVSTGLLQGVGDFVSPVVALFVGVIVKLVATVIFAHRWGIVGVAWSTVAGFGAVAATNFLASAKRMPLEPRLIRHMASTLISGAAMVGVLLIVRHHANGNPVILFAEIGGGAAVYLAGLLLCGELQISQFAKAYRSLSRRVLS